MKDRRDIRLLLADVDGTLLTPAKVLTPAALSAVHDLGLAGVVFAITSGRPPRGMTMLIEPLALRGVLAGFNGGVLFNPDMSVVESHVLDPQTAARAVNLILDRGLDAWIYTLEAWLIRNLDAPHVSREAANVRFSAKVVASFAAADLTQVVKIVGVCDDPSTMAACEAAAQAALGGKASAERSQPYYLDVTHPHANKGAVAETLSRLYDVPQAQIATIGDMPNDALMFARSGLSIAMGNASGAVRAQADVVTDSNAEDGFAKAVRKFVLRTDHA